MKKHWKLILLNLAAISLGLYLALFGFALPGKTETDPNNIQGLLWPGQKQLSEFQLTDHTGNPYSLESLQGQWNLLFFGYTFCPDICPITMSMLREANEIYLQQAPEEFHNLKITFVSVDGERDTPEHLANYIRFYNESWLAVTGDKPAVDSLTGQLGVPYEIEPHEPGARDYLVSHPGTLFLLSPDGKLFALLQQPHEAEEIAQRLLNIRKFTDQRGVDQG